MSTFMVEPQVHVADNTLLSYFYSYFTNHIYLKKKEEVWFSEVHNVDAAWFLSGKGRCLDVPTCTRNVDQSYLLNRGTKWRIWTCCACCTGVHQCFYVLSCSSGRCESVLWAFSADGEAILIMKQSFEAFPMSKDTLFPIFPARVGLLPEAVDLWWPYGVCLVVGWSLSWVIERV